MLFLDHSRQYYLVYDRVRCHGIEDMRTVIMMTMLDKYLYVSRTEDQIEVRL